MALHPAGGATVVLVGLLAWTGYAIISGELRGRLRLHHSDGRVPAQRVSPDTLATAGARLLDTLVGGTIGLLAYALWPTWSHKTARGSLADLVGAQRAYLGAVLDDDRRGPTGGGTGDAPARPPGPARADECRGGGRPFAVRAGNPPHRSEHSQGNLAAIRAPVQATHILRLDAQEARDRHPFPALAPLARGATRMLELIGTSVADGPADGAVAVPDLRSSYTRFEREQKPTDAQQRTARLAELDEIVDATDGLASLAGLGAVDDDRQQPAGIAPT